MTNRRPRNAAWTLAVVLPILAALGWSAHPAFLAAWAIFDAPPFAADASSSGPDEDPTLKRQIQRHFLRHYVYIPLDDIVAVSPDPIPANDTASLVMQKACGRGRLFVWIPFKIRLPFAGEKVFEWCWKPQTKNS